MNAFDRALAVGVVLDASVVINLLAFIGSSMALDKVRCYVTYEVEREILRDPLSREQLTGLRESSLSSAVQYVEMTDDELDTFIDLTGSELLGDLDDGEASTLAVANGRGLVCAIDERKARRICTARFSSITCISTVGLLIGFRQNDILSEDQVRVAVDSCLRYSRMTVLPEERSWVENLLGCGDYRTLLGVRV